MAIAFGSWSSTVPTGAPGAAAQVAASWEGWIEPPSFTGLPSLYLDDQPDGALSIQKGSRLILRRYGDPKALTFQGSVLDTDVGAAPSLSQRITRSETLSVDGSRARS